MAKTFAERMSAELGQPMTVENVPGKYGATGTDLVAKSPADGYTLLLASTGPLMIAPAGNPSSPYNTSKDFSAVGLIGEIPFVLMVSPKLQVNTAAELVSLAKAKPGELRFASSGQSTLSHLVTEYFASVVQVELKPENYQTGPRTYAALEENKVDLFFDSVVYATIGIGSGRAKPIGVFGYKGTSIVPNLPILQQQYPQLRATLWLGLVGPKDLPPPVISKVYAAMVKVLTTTEMKERLAAIGAEVVESTPDTFQKFLELEPAGWRDIIQRRGIKIPQ
jgi:tripartite-type tricarboxylate transporter receptor subunit TctC